MDITTTALADTAPLHLKDAKGDFLFDANNNPVRIHFFGPGTKEFAAIEARQSARALRRMQENDGKPSLPAPDVRAKERAEDLAAVTARFENFTYPPAGDKQGAELFEALYADRKLTHIAAQALKFVDSVGNFSGGSATA